MYPDSFFPLFNPFFFLPIISFPPLSVHLSVSVQDQRAATCSSTTSLRSLGMESWCRCSCLSVMSSPPKCLWIERQTKVNALVGKNDQTEKILVISSSLFFLTNHLLYCSLHPPHHHPPQPSPSALKEIIRRYLPEAQGQYTVVVILNTYFHENVNIICGY